ncbi:MAG: hypothetical protein KGL53_02885 [Elusimicrobia bacterium]|nr:hypothetical protein [Elusimicrobiota bacterium]
MVIYVSGAAEGSETNRGEARVTREGVVEVRLDGLLLYAVPEPDWGLFCQDMLGTSTLPPNLLSPKWATHGLGAAFLDSGQRLQVLHVLAHLACAVPLAALFQGVPFGPLRTAETFFGRRFHDGYANLLVVPVDEVQERLARRRAEREALFAAGCIFEAGVSDHEGAAITFWVRPYRCPASCPDWSPAVHELHDAVEESRRPEAAGL